MSLIGLLGRGFGVSIAVQTPYPATTTGEEPLGVALGRFLAASPGVADLVGSRIQPMRFTRGTAYPRIAYETLSVERTARLDGGRAGLTHTLIRIECQATTYGGAAAIAAEVRAAKGKANSLASDFALDGFRGAMSETFVNACWVQDEYDSEYVDENSDGPAVYARTLDLMVHWQE